jgi:hypothetical protein
MDECGFYAALRETDFSERYYALCNRYPIRDIPLFPLSAGTVAKLLVEIGRTAKRDSRDRSYNCEYTLQRGSCHFGFVIQNKAIVEFWFWLEASGRRIGSNYAVLACESAKLKRATVPEPPYPRPEFHSLEELRLILTECFDLADGLLLLTAGKEGV